MQSRFFISTLTVLSLSLASAAMAKDHKKADKTKVAKECTDKGGTWDKKKKKCTPAPAAAKTDAPTENPAPEKAEEHGDSSNAPE